MKNAEKTWLFYMVRGWLGVFRVVCALLINYDTSNGIYQGTNYKLNIQNTHIQRTRRIHIVLFFNQ
ncbi:hypothetical protein M5D96_001418 [Drosophila gunungcola]|uniref:Uncharacterized protein n=1 Tax=Drosophila gunungcola TaxID=103775 RepID=A0A9P9YYL4_9MUSC|nr:hypothetical protein M5D96_001418 [Drosophila gunungcola]